MTLSTEAIVIGGGVIGLAVADRLSRAGKEVVLLEKEAALGTQTSSRNSEVIHAGIYYPPDSLKAKLCSAGRDQLYDFCQQYGVEYRQTGKYIIATNEAQLSQLAEIKQLAEKNGVQLNWVEGTELQARYPNLTCTKALFSPRTGIIDSHALITALAGCIERQGGTLALKTSVTKIRSCQETIVLDIELPDYQTEVITAKEIINCTGLESWALASSLSTETVPPKHLAKGNYYKPEKTLHFDHLIYPIPMPGGLGIHITCDLAGQIRFGPDVEWVDEVDYTLPNAPSESFIDSVADYLPNIREIGLVPDYCGIRPKCDPKFSDFLFQTSRSPAGQCFLNCFGIESPGLTACLAIADHIEQILKIN